MKYKISLSLALLVIFIGVKILFPNLYNILLDKVSFKQILYKDSRKYDRIRIVGSATLYPYISIVAEQFAKNNHLKTPIIESNGTGGGVNLFCSNSKNDKPDIVTTSRQMKDNEIQKCYKNGVKNITSFLFGYDATIVIKNQNSKISNLSSKQLFFALSANIPHKQKLIPNIYHYWDEIDSSLPHQKIEIYGPSFNSGTRDILVENILHPECMKINEYKIAYPNLNDRSAACKLVRNDGAYINMGDNDNVIIQKIIHNEQAIGMISFSFYKENDYKVKSIIVNDVKASKENITNGTYPLVKKLYLYINEDTIRKVKGYQLFLDELKSENTIGENGYLLKKGFIPVDNI
jgi:phosphate transport system substrate-binding protein